MFTNIISIGNSKGIRIPKALLEMSAIDGKVELKVKRGEIKLVPAKEAGRKVTDTMRLSEKALGADWDKPEEEDAWKGLQ